MQTLGIDRKIVDTVVTSHVNHDHEDKKEPRFLHDDSSLPIFPDENIWNPEDILRPADCFDGVVPRLESAAPWFVLAICLTSPVPRVLRWCWAVQTRHRL